VINIIAPFLLSLFGAWCLAMEFMAYPLENEGLLFVDQKQFLKTVRLGALSFGAVTMIGLTVPVLNIIVGPAAVIGSTMYVYEMREKQQA
jgi:CysZ protein